jgi:hypothetical protein
MAFPSKKKKETFHVPWRFLKRPICTSELAQLTSRSIDGDGDGISNWIGPLKRVVTQDQRWIIYRCIMP